MIVDSRFLPPGVEEEADICIVGAGPAGISIAREFASHQSVRILLLESGGLKVQKSSQRLAEGVTSGMPYYSLDACRLRVLGGSTGFWGGWCFPLDSVDFEHRDWLPYSGWPFPKEKLKDEYARASAICKGGQSRRDLSGLAGNGSQPFCFSDSTFREVFLHIAPTRFGEEFKEFFKNSRNTRLVLHASALEVEMDEYNRTAARLHAATVARKRFTVRARVFILAVGGIENARILLCSRRRADCGIGNDHDLVGRFFADHIHTPVAIFDCKDDALWRLCRPQTLGKIALRRGLSISEEFRRCHQLLGAAFTFHNAGDPHDLLRPREAYGGYESLQGIARCVRGRESSEEVGPHFINVASDLRNTSRLVYRKFIKPPNRKILVGCRAEQTPNPHSRVLLDNSEDAFGTNRAKVDWRVSEPDRESLRTARRLLREDLAQRPAGVTLGETDGDGMADILPAAHHMGTTRMHLNPQLGVVDENCRIHGVTNLYIAGSSVFPTFGWAPPTLTVVALAVRLADHLKTFF